VAGFRGNGAENLDVSGGACGGNANDGLGTGKVAGRGLRSRGNADITRASDTRKGNTVT
jgi:hypothetical protein